MYSIDDIKVSIIIPVYNVEKYLVECLESAIGQTHKNKEIIVVDDGSSDASGEILASYKESNKDLIVIETENRGQSSARNSGIERATGDYIIFLDSDDWIEKETLECCLTGIKLFEVDVVFFNAFAFADGMSEAERKRFDYVRPDHLANKKLFCRDLFVEFVRANKYIVSPCCYMYKRESFLCERFFPGILHEDNLFTTQLLMHENATAVCLPNRLFHRRVRPGSTMTQAKSIGHVNGYFVVAEELLNNEVSNKTCSAGKALNSFIQEILGRAVATAQEAFKSKVPISIRKKALVLFWKTKPRYINPKSALVCIFPEAILIKNKLKKFLYRT